MRDVESHPEVAAYMDRLRRAAVELPESRRAELVEEIRAHLEEALPDGAGLVAVREELDRLGDPEAIVDEARDGARPRDAIPAPVVGQTGNRMATASLVLGIGALCLFWLLGVGLILGMLAVTLGTLGMTRAKQFPGESFRARAKAGLVTGAVATVLSAGVIVLTLPASVDISTELELEPIPDPQVAPVEPSEQE